MQEKKTKQILIDKDYRIIIKENGVTKNFYCKNNDTYNVGDIFISKIVQKNDSLNAFFVNFGDKKHGFLPYKNIFSCKERIGKIKIGDHILVQVKKELRDNKGAYLTNIISLTSQYFVYIPHSDHPGLFSSKKISNTESERIKNISRRFLRSNNDAIIARTESNGVDESILSRDIRNIVSRWDKISSTKARSIQAIEDTNYILPIIYNHLDNNTEIVVQTKKIEKQISKNVNGALSFDKSINIDKEIRSIIYSRILLPSNGLISIDVTEALIAIDVNSFRSREVEKTNIEAATEIINQILIKNLSGIIVIDFISDKRSFHNAIEIIKKGFKDDKARTEISFIEKICICIISRERRGKNIWEVTGKQCHVCYGYGVIPNDETYFSYYHDSNAIEIPRYREEYYLNNNGKKHKICEYENKNIFLGY